MENINSNQCIKDFPALKDVFPFEYIGGGHFRHKGVQKGKHAKTLHGDEAIKFLYNELKNLNVI